MRFRRKCKSFLLVLFSTPLMMGGCDCGGDAHTKSEAPKVESPPAEPPKAPLVKKPEIVDWCVEHGVPESICTRCNAALIEGFKKKGDWCKEHGLPESQCFVCHPDLRAKFEAMAPKRP
ncbi:MAG: hypothetical protein DCC65_16380 [Planctomycetota bacterium]|nr:MAG: hypothetical protein DCC65_16380 [Planctomycetota bacterium]